ncbi:MULTISPECIES: TaqI-like C-terminal specificity domain-containing protein [Mediterranea]|uniref:TaqI-like C-terminal specificity domain-containing protein n=1 Tax=Mediterranea TaxID=1926659 RepID=UPI002010D0C2|nr:MULTISPECIES: TaqI-like C-terminal specificity domain-containing protein [Mediterranea]MCL1608627.1 class I SAM-dependent DNA methyltransferase [Mediterranea sp. ET5]MDM8122803.1 TaqI-like C-terminal specificity domain-containing protein [Mediterranea massiliensis]MDM8198886.1 TaqI-like C-terminal specificity domain-containing protein [Mediterranea massiliensis]
MINRLWKISDYVQHHETECTFNSSDSWVILSPIEQSIKRKIEAVGTPLKDWDIQINYGIKTGFNDAFIISSEKRNEILANCQSEDERKRTDELIRPILRGRDIKRYGYDWANLWLINTHNGIKDKIPRIHIEDYPAVKAHLDLYWNKISKRADKGDTPYNLRNCAYLEDFSKPKMLWKRVGSILRFCYNDNGAFGLDSTCFAIGDNVEFVCCVLNSTMGHYLLKDAPKTGTGDLLVSIQAIEPIQIPQVGLETISELKKLLEENIKTGSISNEKEINRKVFRLYNLSLDEQNYIEANFT